MTLTFALPNGQANSAIIFSKYENGSFKHNDATLLGVTNPDYSFNDAISTYPVGSARLLNGGDFAGGEVSPEPTPVASHTVTKSGSGASDLSMKVDGSAIQSGASVEAGKVITLNNEGMYQDKWLSVKANGTELNPSHGGFNDVTYTMPNTDVEFVVAWIDD